MPNGSHAGWCVYESGSEFFEGEEHHCVPCTSHHLAVLVRNDWANQYHGQNTDFCPDHSSIPAGVLCFSPKERIVTTSLGETKH